MAAKIEGISHVDTTELREIMETPGHPAIVIDVREPEEYEIAHIPGIPLIPMGDIIDLYEQLDRGREYVLVCRSGRRSLEVAKFLQNSGFLNVHNFLGGMLKWQKEALVTAKGLENVVDPALPLNPEQLERTRHK